MANFTDISFNYLEKKYTVARAFLTGKNLAGEPVYGVFLAVNSPDRLVYLSVRFSQEEIAQELSLDELLEFLTNKPTRSEDDKLAKYETELYDYIDLNKIFQLTKGELNAKAIERKITYFASDMLDLSVLTFLELNSLNENELLNLLPFLTEKIEKINHPTDTAEAEKESPQAEDEDAEEGKAEETEQADDTLTIKCEPILDPLAGISAGDLHIGDTVHCRLPEDSSFYKLFENNVPNYDGLMTGEVSAVNATESGSAVVVIDLADNVTGVIKLSRQVKIRAARNTDSTCQQAENRKSFEMIFAMAAVVIFLLVVGILIYIFS